MAKQESPKTICRNKKATHRFDVVEKIECGIILAGTEVKSLRNGRGSLDEAFARMRNGAIWLYGFHIPPYEHGTVNGHLPLAARKLLLHRREIAKWETKVAQKGMTLVPLAVYFNERGKIKVKLALAKGKTLGDKRETMKERDAKREMDRAMRRTKSR